MSEKNVFYKVEWSAIITLVGIILLFSLAILVVLIAPNFVDKSWVSPSSIYQKQMYEVADPNLYISSNTNRGRSQLQFVYHIRDGYTLNAFQESSTVRIVAPPELEKYITRFGENTLKLTSDLLLLREPTSAAKESNFWKKEGGEDTTTPPPRIVAFELYKPEGKEGFAIGSTEGILENWVDENYVILDENSRQEYHKDPGVIYVLNPVEYRVRWVSVGTEKGWRYDPKGDSIENIEKLKTHELAFRSRQQVIQDGEHQYAIEGCWYCHSDQTRTLVQDVVLNGNEQFPAPPSSANEYIYQRITFPATRRIGPDLSRVGIKRPSRDWQKSHFWSPKTASAGSIMPSFQHFFDDDPRGSARNQMGIPNYTFEAIYQYLMTKGTRITAPTQAWWLGKDPVQTIDIIEGRKKLP